MTRTISTTTAPRVRAPRARRLVQIGGSLRKEVAALVRQPRLLLVLVAGPFAILLLFAIGYDQQQSVLRTAFVGPEGSVYEPSIDQFADDLQQYVESAGYSDDLVAAEQQLRVGDIDAIVVFPADPLDAVLGGEQADITVLHNKIDPIQQVAVEVSSQVAVMELNARVLEEVVGQAQDTLAPVQETLTLIDGQSVAFTDAVARGDNDAALGTLAELRASAVALDTVGAASSELAVALGGDDATVQALDEFQATIDDLQATIERTASAASLRPGDAVEITDSIAAVEQASASASTIDPGVVVRPFSIETANLQRQPVNVNDFFAPAAIALLLQHMVLTFAAMSLVSDRTLGMFEVFRVGPMNASRLMAGKYLSFLLVGGAVGAALLALMVVALELPLRGEVLWVAVGIAGLLAASIGFGMVLALLARSDVQAVQFAMLALLAGLFFGGFFLDLEAFDYPVKLVSWALPVTYGIRLLRDVMLRGLDPSVFDLVGLATTTATFAIAAWWLLYRQLRVR